MNDRRRLLMLLCASVVGAPRGASAQAKQPVLIDWLRAGSRESNRRSFAVFKEGLTALGWQEGSQVVTRRAASRAVSRYFVESRYAEVARPEQIEPALSRLAKDRVQALVAMPGHAVMVGRRRIVKFAQEQRWPVAGVRPRGPSIGGPASC